MLKGRKARGNDSAADLAGPLVVEARVLRRIVCAALGGTSSTMTASWDERIELFWASADDARPEEMLEEMRALVGERPSHDPEALYEWASIHDFLGKETEAIDLYRAALERDLQGARRSQATIQLASSLRNAGEPTAAIDLLEQLQGDPVTGDASQAFLALALRDCGRHDDALRVVLVALSRTLPLYQNAVARYAAQL